MRDFKPTTKQQDKKTQKIRENPRIFRNFQVLWGTENKQMDGEPPPEPDIDPPNVLTGEDLPSCETPAPGGQSSPGTTVPRSPPKHTSSDDASPTLIARKYHAMYEDMRGRFE